MITAVIDAGQHYCQAVSDLWQWDYGQTLRIQGTKIPAAVEVQFSTTDRIGETVTRIGVTKDGVTEVPIPDTLLEGGGTTQDYTIYAFVYIENGDSGKTEYRVSMKVRARPKPEAHATPEEGELFRQAIVAVTESADRAESARKSAETAADQAENAKKAAEEAKAAADADKEAAEAAQEKAEAAQKAAKNAETEAKKAQTSTETAKRETETAKTAVETMKSTVAGYADNANVAKKAAETARSEAEKAQTATETAKNDAVQAKEAAERAKIGTAADRETAETASKVARISATSAEESAKKAEAAKEEIQESADQIQKNAIEIDSLKEDKITKPAEAPTIGKIIRVKSVNEDGTFVCEWADSASDLDVRIDGKSIVQDGVAEIPKADTNTHNLGLIRVNAGNGFAVSADGTLNIIECTDDSLKKRYARIVSGNVIDYAVKAAMCDGKGTAWTADEQTAARERMGAWTGDWQIIMDETLAELTQEVSFEVPDDTKEMICYFKSGAAPKNDQVYLRTSNNGSSIHECFASFGGSLSNNTISIGCQKIQFLNSQYGLIEYSYLSHSTPSTADYVQRAGKPSLLRIDNKRFAFHSVDINGGYPVETRLLVLVRR